ncbi:MAG: glycosyl transferase, partial [Phycisphaeraceae bacterium]|nr:glycosyl transferase [Phycisphaeraceae bacterium]
MTDDASMPVKPICFYLPQFHAIPENDAWWGKRFTEWSLVKAATPQFATHRQPREPIAELGYYDLLDSDVRRRQGEIARAHGVYGFCYYHYWFDGKRLLERPLEKMLTDGEPDLPFCLCWANEPWSRRWDGSDQEVLQAQNYGDAAGWDAHFNCLLRFFEHPNYIRVQGRPLLVVYRLGDIDDGPAMIDAWRRRAESAGLPGLHLVAALNHQAPDAQQLAAVDAACEFLPNYLYPQERMRIRRFGILGLQCAEEGWRGTLSLPKAHRVQYRGVFRSWDNTPRFRDRGVVTIDSDTATFRALLDRQFQRAATDPDLPEPFVFV